MSAGMEKLARDLEIMAAMAREMDRYLASEVLFWPLPEARMPKLTLGGYLMRQHRLLALRELLTPQENAQLEAVIIQLNKSLDENIVRFEQKSGRELEARFRQWSEYLKDIDRGVASSRSNYSTAVEARAMIAAVVAQLQLAPYDLDQRAVQQTALLDNQLRRVWEPGEFTWPQEWQPAYPLDEYWWLYGQPKEKKRF